MKFTIAVIVVDKDGEEWHLTKIVKQRRCKDTGDRALRRALDEVEEDYPNWKSLGASIEKIE